MKSLLSFFKSVKLAIILLIIITVASILGTFIPQHRSLDEYLARFGQFGYLFNRLQLTSLYQSLWFVGLLCLLALNIIVCTLSRLTPKFRKAFSPKLAVDAKEINVLKIKERFKKNIGLDEAKAEVKRELASRHYRLREAKRDNKAFFFARKRILGLFGSDIVHLGILIILTGGIVSGAGGFKKNLTFLEGDVLDVPKADFMLRLDKFETEYYPDGNVRDWKSTLTVLENEEPVLSKIIEVNHPLSYKGFVFYQSNYGWNWSNPSVEIWVKKRKDSSFLEKKEMKVRERVLLEDENIQLSVLHFVPDFVINDKKTVTTRSLQPNNPAVFIEGWREKEKIFSGWVFAKFPDITRIHAVKETDYSFEFKNFKAGQFSVIQASKDPGVNFIWFGCAFVMVGLALAFYWPTREIRVVLEESANRTEIAAGGIASKSREAFQSEFNEITTSIRRKK